MNSRANLPAIVLCSSAMLLLSACNRSDQSAPAAVAVATSTGAAAQTFIGQRVEQAMDQARAKMATSNIDISGVDIEMNGRRLKTPAGLPKAEITPQGDLLIAGKPVTVTPEQHAQLLAYRNEIIEVASAGMALGSQGADLGISALTGLGGALLGGEKGQQAYEQRMKSQGKQMETKALALCKQLPPMLATQQQLAASLPEFKPYATMRQQDVDDCGKDIKAKGITATGQ